MPIYLFQNNKTGEVKEVFFHMNDEKKYIDNDGVEWQRVYTIPATVIDSVFTSSNDHIYSQKHFVDSISSKKIKYGEIMDYSAELSEKRAERNGRDPIKEKYYEDYAKKRKGHKHINVVRREAKEKVDAIMKKIGISKIK